MFLDILIFSIIFGSFRLFIYMPSKKTKLDLYKIISLQICCTLAYATTIIYGIVAGLSVAALLAIILCVIAFTYYDELS